MGAGAGIGSFASGLLGGIGEGFVQRRQRQDRLKQMQVEASLSVLSGMTKDPSFAGDAEARADITNAYFQTLQQLDPANNKGKNKKGFGEIQQAVNHIMTKVYPSGKGEPGRPATSVNVPGAAPEGDWRQGYLDKKVDIPSVPASPDRTGPFRTKLESEKIYQQEEQQKADIQLQRQVKQQETILQMKAAAKQAEEKQRYYNFTTLKETGISDVEAMTIAGYKPPAGMNARPTVVPDLVKDPTTGEPSKLIIKADGSKEYVPAVAKAGATEHYVKGLKGLDGRPATLVRTPDGKGGYTEKYLPEFPKPAAGAGAAARLAGKDADKKSRAQTIGDAIMSGTDSPDMSRMYGDASMVREYLDKKGYPLAQAQLDWKAVNSWISAQNSQSQTRIRQATEFAFESLDLVSDLNKDLSQKLGKARSDKFPLWNKGALAYARNGGLGPEAQQSAQKMAIQIADLRSELATVYKGGNSPTDIGMKQAMDLLDGEWTEKTLEKAIELSKKNLRVRLNSIRNTGPAGMSPNSQYGGNRFNPSSAQLPRPDKRGKPISVDDATKYLEAYGGNKEEAMKAAELDGWVVR